MTKPVARLTIQDGDEIGRRYVIRAGQKFTVGRAHASAISIPSDSLVSRQHTTLELTPRGLEVCDLGSRNGTFLDHRRLEARIPILACPKDTLQVGRQIFGIELFGLGQMTQDELERTRKLPRNILPSEEFDVLGEIGRGATGIVYGVYQRALRRNVAVKVPRTDVDDYEESRHRFLREGQLCCRINSPYVVTIYDLRTTAEKRAFMVMELVNGGSARDRIVNSDEHMPLDEIVKIGEDISLALMAIHRLDIIHRDLKPSNILLTPEGIAKLADFGIAKQLNHEEEWTSLTPSNEGLGTLGYVSPEGAMCEILGPQADIYSLGATLYHMITGRPPFITKGDSMSVIIERILSQPPVPIKELRPDCPDELARLIESMLEKDPTERPQGAVSLASKLKKTREKHLCHSKATRELKPTDGFSREEITDSIFG